MKLLCGFALILLMLTENLEGVHGDARYAIMIDTFLRKCDPLSINHSLTHCILSKFKSLDHQAILIPVIVPTRTSSNFVNAIKSQAEKFEKECYDNSVYRQHFVCGACIDKKSTK